MKCFARRADGTNILLWLNCRRFHDGGAVTRVLVTYRLPPQYICVGQLYPVYLGSAWFRSTGDPWDYFYYFNATCASAPSSQRGGAAWSVKVSTLKIP